MFILVYLYNKYKLFKQFEQVGKRQPTD